MGPLSTFGAERIFPCTVPAWVRVEEFDHLHSPALHLSMRSLMQEKGDTVLGSEIFISVDATDPDPLILTRLGFLINSGNLRLWGWGRGKQPSIQTAHRCQSVFVSSQTPSCDAPCPPPGPHPRTLRTPATSPRSSVTAPPSTRPATSGTPFPWSTRPWPLSNTKYKIYYIFYLY